MAELPYRGMYTAGAVGRIAAAPGSITDRAELLLEALRDLVPFPVNAVSPSRATGRPG